MSLTNAMNSALSGLRASSVAAEVVGSNISNSLNETYAQRRLVLGQGVATGGVRVLGVDRMETTVVEAGWRSANAGVSADQLQLDASNRISKSIGIPTEAGSLDMLLVDFETALISAASRPDLDQRLSAVTYAANGFIEKLNSVSSDITNERRLADQQISQSVEQVNAILQGIEKANARIVASQGNVQTSPQLYDQRDALLNDLSSFVDLRLFQRESGAVSVYSADGVNLVDAKARELSFSPSPSLDPSSRIEDGDLSRLSVDGVTIASNKLGGGRIAALFALRDETLVGIQSELDGIALDFADRVNSPVVDPTLSAGQPGLLTDYGSVVAAGALDGLAGRLTLNQAVDASAGGDPRLLRDGLYALSARSAGDPTLLANLSNALVDTKSITTGPNSGRELSLFELVSSFSSSQASMVLRKEASLASSKTQMSSYQSMKTGVDTDAELQKLLVIEQSYGANARVIQTVDELMNTLLEVV